MTRYIFLIDSPVGFQSLAYSDRLFINKSLEASGVAAEVKEWLQNLEASTREDETPLS